MHGDDVGRHNARIGSVHHNAFVLHPLRQVKGEERQRQLGVAVDRDAPEFARFSPQEEVGKVKASYGIGARHHVDDAAPLSHQRQQLAGQQVGTYVVHAYRLLQSVFGDVPSRLQRTGIVHQQAYRHPLFQYFFGKG